MILDSRNISSVRMGLEAMADLRLAVMAIENHETIIQYIPKHCNVLEYYLNPRTLLTRICDIAGVSHSEVTLKAGKSLLKPIAWVILTQFGHTDANIIKLFGLKKNIKGQSNYYRHKMRDNMIKYPATVEIYSHIQKMLEKDKSNLMEELYESK